MDRAIHPNLPSLSRGPVPPPSERTLEELLADRIAAEAARIAEERVREIVSLEVLDPDEVLGPMKPAEAANFLDLKYATFKEIAPNLPRIFVTPGNPRYLRRELLEHFRRERGLL